MDRPMVPAEEEAATLVRSIEGDDRCEQWRCSISCATANPVQVVVAETDLGHGILGVVDGLRPAGVEAEADEADGKALLRRIG